MAGELAVRETPIPGLLVVDLVLHEDARGWFKENYQQAKMEALGLPHFDAIQNNFSFNKQAGVTRGLHAEPWEKYTSLANGRAFCAWVDLRKGDSFGTVFTMEITPDTAVFVPRGVANSYQTLEAGITYTYLVNAHWSPEATYSAVNLFDPALGIDWPIPKEQALVSGKDQTNPLLQDVTPMEFTA
ncbi:MAG TPA: dTDP-4-dehydrorhamnose 3,5-epimerase [Candidatus Saccharimonadales bacterium]|nr:dTDP-4-dehydrorhamnose 3,5-epimerase [Candidatus Saccharimonadales bacterium]